ncbi:MAG: zinc-dependent alcohol dehydrogenase [Anaerolineae bacterium]
MLALVKNALGEGHVGVREVPEPEPGSGQVRVRVEAAGICGSDLHIYHGRIKFTIVPPVVIGHEFAGVIDKIGPGVEDLQPGMAVTAETAASFCGACEPCRTGRYNLCPERLIIGYARNGCFARYVVVDAVRIRRLPPGVSTLAGALCEPLAVVVHAVSERARTGAGEVALVTGPGAIGLLTAQAAAAAGATVVLVGTPADEARLRLARDLGIPHALMLERDDVLSALAAITSGRGADVAFECAGAGSAYRLCLDLVKRGGRLMQVGLFGKPVEADLDLLAYKEIDAGGAISSVRSSWERMLRLLGSGKVQTEPLITHRYRLDQWQEAFATFEARQGVKLAFIPD